MEQYICYDGVDNDFTYYETEQEAIQALKLCIEQGLENVEWLDNVSSSFVAKITHEIKEEKIDIPPEYEGCLSHFIDMIIKEVK